MISLYSQQVIDCIKIVGLLAQTVSGYVIMIRPKYRGSISMCATIVDKAVWKTQLGYMYSSYLLFAINKVRMWLFGDDRTNIYVNYLKWYWFLWFELNSLLRSRYITKQMTPKWQLCLCFLRFCFLCNQIIYCLFYVQTLNIGLWRYYLVNLWCYQYF